MAKGKFYVTTPIYYPTARPHIGNAYTTVVADVLARWHRLKGEKVFFLTGTDEHGQKLDDAAKEKGIDPKKYVDALVEDFKNAWKTLNIEFDGFVRTTDKNHEDTVKKLIKKIYRKGDLYEGVYEGLYCVPEEKYWTEKDLVNGKCPDCNRDVKKLREKAYFFKLSKYQKKLLELYEKNPSFLLPESKRNEILNRIKEGLNDVNFTRSRFKWGVEFPEDKNYVLWVWADALTNYISALDWPKGKNFKNFWPADIHLIGKDIMWFHSVIWPAMLLSAGIKPPKTVFAHGWWTVEGQKMSKSLGNAIDPIEISRKYSVDAFRYFLIREMPLGQDGDFSQKSFVNRLNGELVADLGNLIYRVLTLAERFNGKIQGKPELEKFLDIKKIDKFILNYDTFNAIEEIWKFIRHTNKYINENEPWKLEGKKLSNVLYNLVESCRIISILIYPFMPKTSEKINEQLGTKLGTLKDCKFKKFKGKIKKGQHLFNKVEIINEEKKGGNLVKYEDFEKLDLRVAEIIEAENIEGTHLVKLSIDLGGERRQIVAKIQDSYPAEELLGKQIVVIANLEPRTIKGIESKGMLLAAEDGQPILIVPDREVKVGSKIG